MSDKIRNVGERKTPSKEALDKFVEIYKKMVKQNGENAKLKK